MKIIRITNIRAGEIDTMLVNPESQYTPPTNNPAVNLMGINIRVTQATQATEAAAIASLGRDMQIAQVAQMTGDVLARFTPIFGATNIINPIVLNQIARSFLEQNAPAINLQIVNRQIVEKRVINTPPPDLNRVIAPHN